MNRNPRREDNLHPRPARDAEFERVVRDSDLAMQFSETRTGTPARNYERFHQAAITIPPGEGPADGVKTNGLGATKPGYEDEDPRYPRDPRYDTRLLYQQTRFGEPQQEPPPQNNGAGAPPRRLRRSGSVAPPRREVREHNTLQESRVLFESEQRTAIEQRAMQAHQDR